MGARILRCGASAGQPAFSPRGSRRLSRAAAALPGDVNVDGKVDFADLVVLARHYGMSSAAWGDGDFNSDGSVGFDDLVALARNYGQSNQAALLPDVSDPLSLKRKHRRPLK